jgi:adenylate cyclase
VGIEIERKFLVSGDAWRVQVTRCAAMRQGYLGATEARASVRVRLEDAPGPPGTGAERTGPAAHLNIKAAVVGTARAEFEYAIPAADARQMLDTLCVGLVEKLRHYVPAGAPDLTWEIDEFTGANQGLIVAELELGHADQPFERPPWLGREVSGERRYYNHALALRPYRDWAPAERG